jgi:mycothiol synthase
MEIRPSQGPDDVALEVAIHNAVRPYDPVDAEERDAYTSSLPDFLSLLAFEDGRAVGSGLATVEPHRPIPVARAWVLADRRRRGIGTALYRELSVWAARRGNEALETWIDERQPQALEYVRRRGFTEIGRELILELDLTHSDPPAVEAPQGIEIVTWAQRPDLTRALYEVAVECYPDIPGQEEDEMEPFEAWLEHDMGAPGDRPEGTFAAVAHDEVVGYAKFHLAKAQPTVAHHDLTGVKRAWRGRGVARALKAAQIAWAKAAGYERLVTRNEERNTPIRRLNERFGYKPAPGRILFRGPLASSG